MIEDLLFAANSQRGWADEWVPRQVPPSMTWQRWRSVVSLVPWMSAQPLHWLANQPPNPPSVLPSRPTTIETIFAPQRLVLLTVTDGATSGLLRLFHACRSNGGYATVALLISLPGPDALACTRGRPETLVHYIVFNEQRRRSPELALS